MVPSPPKPISIKLMPRSKNNRNQFTDMILSIMGKVCNNLQIAFKCFMTWSARKNMFHHLRSIIEIIPRNRIIVMPAKSEHISTLISSIKFTLDIIQIFRLPTNWIRKMQKIKTGHSRISPCHIISITTILFITPATGIRIKSIHFIIVLPIYYILSSHLLQIMEQNSS